MTRQLLARKSRLSSTAYDWTQQPATATRFSRSRSNGSINGCRLIGPVACTIPLSTGLSAPDFGFRYSSGLSTRLLISTESLSFAAEFMDFSALSFPEGLRHGPFTQGGELISAALDHHLKENSVSRFLTVPTHTH